MANVQISEQENIDTNNALGALKELVRTTPLSAQERTHYNKCLTALEKVCNQFDLQQIENQQAKENEIIKQQDESNNQKR